MILKCDNRGFSSEYSRNYDYAYIEKEPYHIETVEPLHCLMEGATKNNWQERIDLSVCLFYIREQLRIIRNDLPSEKITEYKYAESIKYIDANEPPDKKEYENPSAIVRILSKMSGSARLAFIEAGKELGRFPLVKANYIQGGIFEIEIKNPYELWKKKTIELAIETICLKKDRGIEFRSTTYSFYDKAIPEYVQIIKAMESNDKRIRLNASYLIRMVQ